MLSQKKILLLAVTALLMLPLLALGMGGPAEFVTPVAPASAGCCCEQSDGNCCKGPQKECPSEGCAQCTNPACSKLVLFFELPDAPTLDERAETVEVPAPSEIWRSTRPQVPPPDAA